MDVAGSDQPWMPDEATSRAFGEAVAAFGERVDGLPPVSRDERVKTRFRRDDDPELTPPVVEAYAATYQMVNDDLATPRALAAVLWCAASRRTYVSEPGTDMLNFLAAQFNIAQQAIVWLSRSRHWYARQSALASLSIRLPADLNAAVITNTLADKSSSVRFMATRCVSRCEARSTLTALRRALQIEQDDATREFMDTMYHTCDKGFYFSPHIDDEGNIELCLRTVRVRNGVGLSYSWYSKKLHDRIGPEMLATLAAKRPEPFPDGINPLPAMPSTAEPIWLHSVAHRQYVDPGLANGASIPKILKSRHGVATARS